jgi:hypothetical protein
LQHFFVACGANNMENEKGNQCMSWKCELSIKSEGGIPSVKKEYRE